MKLLKLNLKTDIRRSFIGFTTWLTPCSSWDKLLQVLFLLTRGTRFRRCEKPTVVGDMTLCTKLCGWLLRVWSMRCTQLRKQSLDTPFNKIQTHTRKTLQRWERQQGICKIDQKSRETSTPSGATMGRNQEGARCVPPYLVISPEENQEHVPL